MTDDEMMKLANELALELSLDLAVPLRLYENSPTFIDWRGRFTVRINGRDFNMAVTPSTLFVNESDPTGPVAHKVGSEWIETPSGRLFHADYLTSRIQGGFQIFRQADGSPFDGFAGTPHTHMLVYTNGAEEKQFFPVVIDFTEK